jgi:hypothetical protein
MWMMDRAGQMAVVRVEDPPLAGADGRRCPVCGKSFGSRLLIARSGGTTPMCPDGHQRVAPESVAGLDFGSGSSAGPSAAPDTTPSLSRIRDLLATSAWEPSALEADFSSRLAAALPPVPLHSAADLFAGPPFWPSTAGLWLQPWMSGP